MRQLFSIILFVLAAIPVLGQNKTTLETQIEQQGFIDIQTLCPSIRVSLMYARPDNFTGKILYQDLHHAYLHPKAAKALKKAQTELKRTHPELSLIVFDAARPMSVQQKMWNLVAGTSKNIYVSNPRNGGGLHNYGLAVDITLCDTASGDTLHMGTKIDYMGKLAHVRAETEMHQKGFLNDTALQNRKLLRKVMGAAGFKVLQTEWWHFNYCSRAEAKAKYKVIK